MNDYNILNNIDTNFYLLFKESTQYIFIPPNINNNYDYQLMIIIYQMIEIYYNKDMSLRNKILYDLLIILITKKCKEFTNNNYHTNNFIYSFNQYINTLI